MKRVCRVGRLLLTRWRRLCQPDLARPQHLADGDHRHEDATDSEIEDVFRWMSNQRVLSEYELDVASQYEARSSFYTRGPSCVNALVKKPWLVRPRQPCVLSRCSAGGGEGGRASWVAGRSPSTSCWASFRQLFDRFGRHVSPACCDDDTREQAPSKGKAKVTVFLEGN